MLIAHKIALDLNNTQAPTWRGRRVALASPTTLEFRGAPLAARPSGTKCQAMACDGVTGFLDNADNYIYIIDGMNFLFDPEKRRINLRKHGLDLADAERVFAGETFTRPDNRFHYGEMRFSTVGLLGVEVVVIAHSENDDTIRVVSMRKAERHERKNYFAALQG